MFCNVTFYTLVSVTLDAQGILPRQVCNKIYVLFIALSTTLKLYFIHVVTVFEWILRDVHYVGNM